MYVKQLTTFPIAVFLFFFAISDIFAGSIFFNNAKLNYKIIVPRNPSKIEIFAAEELKNFIEQSYSRPISVNGQETEITFFIGFSSETIKKGFSDIDMRAGRFGISRIKSDFLFWGYDYKDLDPVETKFYSAGTLSSVYYFLNKYVGINFFMPGDNGYSLTHNKHIQFKTSNDIPQPTFKVRGFSSVSKDYTKEQMNIFSRRMLCHFPFWSKRDFNYIFLNKWEKRFCSTNPEYFMMRDGKRVCESYPLHVPCLSNPDVIRQVASDIVSEINCNPNIKVVKIFCDAPIEQCQCKRCESSPERKLCGKDTNSGEEVYGFQKKVIDLVRQAHPDTWFISQTKGGSYYAPPELLKVPPRFTVYVLTDYPLPNANHTRFIKLMNEWNATGAKTILKSYPRWPAFKTYPIMNTKVLQSYLKNFKGIASGMTNSDLKQKTPYMFCAFGQYAQAKMLFDLNIRRDELLLEFCQFAYPGAETEMIAFYDEMEHLFSKCTSFKNPPLKDFYYYDNLKKAMSYLETASTKVNKNDFFKPLYDNFRVFYQQANELNTRL
jgi:hypothetical protein